VAGLGAGLPGAAQIAPFAAANMCEVIGAPFPRTTRDVLNMRGADLNRLSMMFNDDFGIVEGDSLSRKRALSKA
jgi:hypothetical protein